MKLASVNVGLPREVTWHGRIVTTGIFKEPVDGRVGLRKLNLDGDRQADLTVHGGKDKAVYCYPLAHYGYWKKELPGRELPPATFGENFTTDGLLEDWRPVLHRFRGIDRDPAPAPLLQTGYKISVRRHGKAIHGERTDRFLLRCHPRGRSQRRG